jgi:hypothetical protein
MLYVCFMGFYYLCVACFHSVYIALSVPSVYRIPLLRWRAHKNGVRWLSSGREKHVCVIRKICHNRENYESYITIYVLGSLMMLTTGPRETGVFAPKW